MRAESIRSEFANRGVVHLDRAFSANAAARIRDVVWQHAERTLGLKRDDPSSWPRGWLPISWKGIKRNHAFDVLLDNPAVTTAFGVIFGPSGWQPPKPGAQVLMTLPGPGPWALPDSWHMDCGFEQPTWPVPAVKAFACFGAVGPRGGGTMVLAGSHRLVAAYRREFPEPPPGGNANWRRFLRRYPPLDELLGGASQPDLGRSMVGRQFDIEGVPIEVLELTGTPGDITLTHLHVFHAASPNTAGAPKQMLGKTVFAA
jgi:hypothetical protein